MKPYPLIFTFRDMLAGNGFVAEVYMRGHVLLGDEGDGFWTYGVQPGGIAAGGLDRGSALSEFREQYKSVLYDIAAEAGTFEELRAEFQGFFQEQSPHTRELWVSAREQVRRGEISLQGMDKVDSDHRVPELQVTEVEPPRANPARNRLDTIEEAA